jgi:hypothetical protein
VPQDQTDLAIVEMPVPFAGTYSHRGTPKRSRHLLLGMTPVAIPKVNEADAPVVLRVDEVSVGGWTVSMEWRDHRGAYWRPLMEDGNRVLRVSAAVFAEANPHLDFRCWADSPFGWHLAKRLFDGVDPSAPYHDPDGRCWGTLREDGSERAFAEAQRLAMDCLAEIGGVLHRRAAPPMWSIEPTSWARDGIGSVKLRLPETALSSWPVGLFPLDRLDEALDATRRLGVGVLENIPKAVPGGEGLRTEDYEVAALCMAKHAASGMLDAWPVPIFSDETKEAYRHRIEVIDRIERPGRLHSDGDLDRAYDSFEVFADRPDVDRRIRVVKDLLAASIGALRFTRLDDEDVAALSALAL